LKDAMRIAQIILTGTSEYERKSQRADQAALAERHEVMITTPEAVGASAAEIAHVYASEPLPPAPFIGFPLPYVASAPMRRSRWSLRRPEEPGALLSPLGERPVPEVVEDVYFAFVECGGRAAARKAAALPPHSKTIGSFARASTKNMVEQTIARIRRFRDDIVWRVFDGPPSPEDLAGVDVWVDPAVDESDFDGFVAEALVVGLPVVASRTAINFLRLEKGRTGILVPPRDPNEMTHAILAALFRSEVIEPKKTAARQTASKFRPRQRLRVLTHLYEHLLSGSNDLRGRSKS
jgi:hypothetical protein